MGNLHESKIHSDAEIEWMARILCAHIGSLNADVKIIAGLRPIETPLGSVLIVGDDLHPTEAWKHFRGWAVSILDELDDRPSFSMEVASVEEFTEEEVAAVPDSPAAKGSLGLDAYLDWRVRNGL